MSKQLVGNCEIVQEPANSVIFKKDNESCYYYFILKGDMKLAEDFAEGEAVKIQRSLTTGTIVGHKFKDILPVFGVSSSEILVARIFKETYNKQLEAFHEKVNMQKNSFLNRFYPNFRSLGKETQKSIASLLVKYKFQKHSRLITEGELNDYIFLIVTGQVSAIKAVKDQSSSHLIFESYSRWLIRQRRLCGSRLCSDRRQSNVYPHSDFRPG